MNLGTFTKQPVDVKDYDLDYSEWLVAADTVEAAEVTVEPSGLTVGSVFTQDKKIKVWLSAGTNGTVYKLTVTMTTADGRVKQDEFKVKVKDT